MKEKAYIMVGTFSAGCTEQQIPAFASMEQGSLIGAGHGQKTVCFFFCPRRALKKTKTKIKSSKDNDSIKEKRIMVIRETKRKPQTLKT